jgi:hypothetical protein
VGLKYGANPIGLSAMRRDLKLYYISTACNRISNTVAVISLGRVGFLNLNQLHSQYSGCRGFFLPGNGERHTKSLSKAVADQQLSLPRAYMPGPQVALQRFSLMTKHTPHGSLNSPAEFDLSSNKLLYHDCIGTNMSSDVA